MAQLLQFGQGSSISVLKQPHKKYIFYVKSDGDVYIDISKQINQWDKVSQTGETVWAASHLRTDTPCSGFIHLVRTSGQAERQTLNWDGCAGRAVPEGREIRPQPLPEFKYSIDCDKS